jgi:hypothetical protein
MLDMRCGVVEVALAKPQVGPQRSDVAPRPEARPQQSIGVQPLQPLRIVDVDLSPGNTSASREFARTTPVPRASSTSYTGTSTRRYIPSRPL